MPACSRLRDGNVQRSPKLTRKTSALFLLDLFSRRLYCLRARHCRLCTALHWSHFSGRNRGSVHTYPFLFEPFFLPLRFGLPSYPVKTATENEFFFKNALQSAYVRLLVYVWTDENAGFRIQWCHTSYTSSTTHAPYGMLVYFHRFSVFVWTSKKRCEYLRVGRIFYFILFLFWKRRKKISVFKNIRILWKGPETALQQHCC